MRSAVYAMAQDANGRPKERSEAVEYTNSWISDLIDEHIHSERNRGILKRSYIDGIGQERIAEEYGMSTRQIQNIIKHFRLNVLAKIKNS